MTDVFLYGPLCHAPLAEVVLGRPARPATAWVAGTLAATEYGATLIAGAGAGAERAEGRLLVSLTTDEFARLAVFAEIQAQTPLTVDLHSDAGQGAAVSFIGGDPLGPWDAAAWQASLGPVTVQAARDAMELYGQVPAADLARRWGAMLVRAASALRAGMPSPAGLRRRQGQGDVVTDRLSRPYAHFFAVEEADLRFRRFDGALSPRVNRAGFIMGDAVTVLPYDPIRDRVLLVEQFRVGPHLRGAAESWSLEAIAGRIDPGETPEDAARREAVEEAGLHLGALLPVAGYYPSPGAVTEYLYSFVALADLPDDAAGVFGVAGEAEDIRGHLIGFDTLMALITSGEVENAPLILTALWLQRERPRLRG